MDKYGAAVSDWPWTNNIRKVFLKIHTDFCLSSFWELEDWKVATQLPMSRSRWESAAAVAATAAVGAAAAAGRLSSCVFAAADRNLNDSETLTTQPSGASGLSEGFQGARHAVF